MMDQPRLYRSSVNRIIAGVAGGLAEYFHVDPSLVRLLWVLIIFLGGAGILAYIIAWIVIPAQDSVFPDNRAHTIPVNTRVSSQETKVRHTFLMGAALIGLGLLFLFIELFSLNFHKYFWPLILIGGGIFLLLGTGRARPR